MQRKDIPGYLTLVAATVAAVSLLISGSAQCTAGILVAAVPQTKAHTPAKSGARAAMPAPITQVGEYGEDIYDAVDARKWSQASSLLSKLQAAQRQLDKAVSNQARAKEQLTSTASALRKNIANKNRHQALLNANRVTFIAADMSSAYSPRIPVQITKLDYYGRELMIWSEAKNTPMLKENAKQLELTWGSVRSDVVNHGGKAAAQQFDKLVNRLKAAKTPAEYRSVATPILDSVDVLERVYTK